MNPLARRRRDHRGLAMVEMAIVTPFLLLIAFGIIEFGSVHNKRIEISQGVREGARLAARGEYASCGGVEACTQNRIGGDLGAGTTVWVVVPTSAAIGDEVTVCASSDIHPITPIMGQFLNGKSITSEMTMRIEKASSLVSTGGEPSWCG
jgi:hypothetical protein